MACNRRTAAAAALMVAALVLLAAVENGEAQEYTCMDACMFECMKLRFATKHNCAGACRSACFEIPMATAAGKQHSSSLSAAVRH